MDIEICEYPYVALIDTVEVSVRPFMICDDDDKLEVCCLTSSGDNIWISAEDFVAVVH